MPIGISHANYDRLLTEPVIEGKKIERVRLTTLHVPTGQIVVTDPLAGPDYPPLARTVPPGEYPVDLYLAEVNAYGSTRVAAAILTFSEGPAARYELALLEGQDLSKLAEGQYYGFPVDAGMGGFYDFETSTHYNAFIDELDDDANIYDNVISDLLMANSRKPDQEGDWCDFHLPHFPSHNVAIFQSGYGDGVYPAYWGVNAAGETVNLVIDFELLFVPAKA